MEAGAGTSHTSSGSQDQRPSIANRKAQGKSRQRKRTQRRRKGILKLKGEAKGQKSESLENSSVSTQEPAGTQHMGLHREDQLHPVKKKQTIMVHAQTQTRHPEGSNVPTQTPVWVHHSDQETQTEEQEEPSVPPSDTGETQAEENKISDQDSAQPPGREADNDGESPNPAENLSGATTPDRSKVQIQKGEDQKTYAKAVMGKSRTKTQTNTETSEAQEKLPEPPQNLHRQSPAAPPAVAPIFTFYIYALLDRKFKFKPEHDKLVLLHGDQSSVLDLTHFSDEKQEGYLVEAKLCINNNWLKRGSWLTYQYGVKQRQKKITEFAERNIQIPSNQNIKELHLYEGLIGRQEERSFWKSSLQFVGLNKPKADCVSDDWQLSARHLLERIFQKWSPSEKGSRDSLCRHLNHFHNSLGSADKRVFFSDASQPPPIMVPELVTKILILILKAEPRDEVPASVRETSPLVVGLSVFLITRKLDINLGMKGWAELCLLLSSETTTDKRILEELPVLVPNAQHVVLGLINHCLENLVSEVVLLIPLLLRLRQPGADATRLGLAVEEENWSAMENVHFRRFRKNIRLHQNKRRRVLTLIQTCLPSTKDRPLVLISWLSLLALEDLPEFSDLTGVPAEHLIQSLLYRLRQWGEEMSGRGPETVKRLLEHILLRVDRMSDCGNIEQAFESSIGVMRSTCGLVRLVPDFQTAVLSFQLVLKLAEILDANTSAEESGTFKEKLSEDLQMVQQHVRDWRDELLRKPLTMPSRSLNYPKEIEMWDALLKVECSLEEVTSSWSQNLEKDLKKWISRASEEDQVTLYCLQPSQAAITKSHAVVQACFSELCRPAVSTICQRGQEGDLMRMLSSKVNLLPDVVTSAFLVESAARFREDYVSQLLDPQSAMNHFLSHADWRLSQVDDAAAQLVHSCLTALRSLLEALVQGDVLLGNLQTCLKYKDQFKQLYQQYKKMAKSEAVTVDADAVLAQREADLMLFMLRRQQIDTLINMIGKVTESVTVPEMLALEEHHSADLRAVSLNKLVPVQCFYADGRLGKGTQALWYKASLDTLEMANQMHRLHNSNLILSSWVREAARLASSRKPCSAPVPVSLKQIYENVWKPLQAEFCQRAESIGNASVTFKQLDQILLECGEQGDGKIMRGELNLMSTMISKSKMCDLEESWVEVTLGQIKEYCRLCESAAAAGAILRIAKTMKLSGNFDEITPLIQMEEDAFKQRALWSLTDDLFAARNQLSTVTKQHTVCLEEFLASQSLVSWVKDNLKNRSDVKVYVELATITAGETDTEIDQVFCFHDAVMGYSALIYSLPPQAGFKDFMKCAEQVFEAQSRDERLADKLRESTRLLDWLKMLKETHGSVEQSSLSLASSINAAGVYHVGWSDERTEKMCLQNMVELTVTRDKNQKAYTLEELLELQNKLMLMSTKGEHGIEQVRRFTEVFEGVQRLGTILLHMQTSGNMLFRSWSAEIQCCPQQQQLCIRVTFASLMGKEMLYYGEVRDQLRMLTNSMDTCQGEWRSFISEMRSRFSLLNFYTSEQMVYLCHWVLKVCEQASAVPPLLHHLLLPIKPQCTLADISLAYTEAASMTLRHDGGEDAVSHTEEEEQDAPASPGRIKENMQNADDLMQFSSEDEDDDNMECDVIGKDNESSLEDLWCKFKRSMAQFLTQYLDIPTLASFLSCLSERSQQFTVRKLPSVFEEGKPNLVLCPGAEVFTSAVSLYMESPEQPLPSTDEVLVCREQTTEEEVEIFLRRALCQGQNWEKIYCVVNPGLLGYDVSVAFGEFFEVLKRTAEPNYRLIIISPVEQQHKYVPSFFSGYKVQAGVSQKPEAIRKYLHHHFAQKMLPQCCAAEASPEGLSVWMVSSVRPAVGKSLFVDRLFKRFQQKDSKAKCMRIRLMDPHINTDSVIKDLAEQLEPLRQLDPVLLHIDSAGVQSGLEELLFHLLILGCLSDSHGKLWRRNVSHLICVEVLLPQKKPNQRLGLLDVLPTIQCRPPKEVKQLLNTRRRWAKETFDPLMDEQEFVSEEIQRPYQYLKLYRRNENLDHFIYMGGSRKGDPFDCIDHLLSYCGMQDPSWAELKNFSSFLNVQLKDCENSVFCDANFMGNQLPGFKNFIVKFMILMARDFASPSLNTCDESPRVDVENSLDDDLLASLTVRKHWENESHPYIFFNADRFSMSFLGFNVIMCKRQNILNAVDPQTLRVLIQDVMSERLFQDLIRQRISLSENFDQLPRKDKIKRISFVVGAMNGMSDNNFDPDPTYELTADNVMKMLAIHMRFRCGIPVVIMGETGCGKTRLISFLCAMQRGDETAENMVLVKVHGGTTADMIHRKVREVEILAEKNRRMHNLDTILFFDEANTTEAIYAIKEVLCDSSVKGKPLKADTGLKIIAACNPYRKHSPEMVERLECAGLGYRVRADKTEDRLGKVPLRQLVYRVHPLPPSMASLVWDFGQLTDSTELSYIRLIVRKTVEDHRLPLRCMDIISNVLSASQIYMRTRKDECSFVSLRDVERSMRVLVWFYQHCNIIFHSSLHLSDLEKTLKCLALSVGVCYYPSLVDRDQYLSVICRHFPVPLCSTKALQDEISTCQDVFLNNIKTRETIAKNVALKENVFLMVVCIELRIPLFLVGKPGSSKSLAKTVVADAMQGQNSHSTLFRNLKQVHMLSFQCSPHSSPDGIIGTFRSCARFQRDKNMDEYISVVVLDEVGLAEDSPQMPLKTLHPLLEDGCIEGDKPDPNMKVGFVGISNWALDPAKMNRGIFVSRGDPGQDELVETAKGICVSSRQVLLKIKHLFPSLARAFSRICAETSKNQFFGLRDYYSLVKMLFATVKLTQQEPDGKQLVEAILRNFSGQPEGFSPLTFFQEVGQDLMEIPRPSTLQMVRNNLDHDTGVESRYLLLLTTNNAALHILQQQIFGKGEHPQPEIIFGSGFPKDQEYAQICRNVNRVKTCMETGRTVILLNMQNLYESLYDALNQYYVYLGKQQYVDLGLGSHRVKCRVHSNFKLVVAEDQKKVYEQFPVPLINRLEKHRLDRSTDLEPWQHRVLHKLTEWLKDFSGEALKRFSLSDIVIGYHDDACGSALLQALERRGQKTKDGVLSQHQQENDKPIASSCSDGSDETIQSFQTDNAMEIQVTETEHVLMETNGDHCTEGGSTVLLSEGQELMDVEDSAGSVGAIEEEEVFDLAKCLLLNCVTPDAMVRLRGLDLTEQDVQKLQRIYFQQQHHQSLQDFLQNHLNSCQSTSRFFEITTFSSLVTRSDIRSISQALQLDKEKILLLSLHQFDTEASFCNKLRSFLQNADHSLHILLIQMDLEESHCSDELIASAKYCTMNSLMSLDGQTCWVVFIVKVSRFQSHCRYLGFQGGVWHSVHIDDLRIPEDMSSDLLCFCGTLISTLLCPAPPEHNEDGDTRSRDFQTAGALHSLSLVRSCVQKAVGLLRDTSSMASRSVQRMNILLTLLGATRSDTGAHFQEGLLARLVEAITKKEEMMGSPRDWVSTQAKNRQALQEGGTLRHTLWRHLQCVVTPLLANILEVIDRFANLDLLTEGKLTQGLEKLWLNILADSQILDLTVLEKPSIAADQEVLVEHYFVLDGEEHHCAAPFSWLVTLHLESLWEESEFIPVTTEGDEGRILQFLSLFNNSRLGHHFQALSAEDRSQYDRNYLQDFLLLSFKIKSEEELMVFFRAMLGCVSELQASLGFISDLSPAWILAAARRFGPRLDTLHHILLLQPQLVTEITQKRPKNEPKEMTEDIVALGVCIEQTKFLTVASLQECETFVSRVEFLQPCLERAFSQKYSSLCSPGCSQELGTIRLFWHGILVVASLIQHIIFNLKQSDPRLKEVALKHCSFSLHLMQESPDIKTVETLKKLIRILNSLHDECISRELRFGIFCPVCLDELTEPSVLPCQHVTCLTCLQRYINPHRHSCPTCRMELPLNFKPTVSLTIKAALQQQADIRGYCNGFFLEVVSRFCLPEGQQPAEGVVDLLFSLIVFASGDIYRTRELTPFLQCMDNSPVVRSVLPKLLMRYSFDQMKVHIQTYLNNLEKKVLSPEDSTQLYLLFVNCFQDSLLCSEARELESKEEHRQAEIRFLSRMARKQTPDRQGDHAEFLLNTAKLRICLSSAAVQMEKAATQGGDNVDIQYLQQVKAVCEYSGNNWYRVYLLRAVHRLSGVDCILYLMNNPSWSWVFPPDLLRLQRMSPENMDQFLCCGTTYQDVRFAVTRFIVETRTKDIVSEIKKLRGSQVSLLALALFRLGICRYKSHDTIRPLSQQETNRLLGLLQVIRLDEYRDFCAALLSNKIGGAGSSLHVHPDLSIQRQILLELLVHLGSVLLTINSLLIPLKNIAFQPQNVTNSFLPTMVDDHTSEASGWLGNERLRTYYCVNGHACFVGECGKPVVVSRCPDCKIPIGGSNHIAVQGFSLSTSSRDKTRTGHILGEAGQRSDAPERQMTYAQSCILRLLTHLAMLQGSIRNQKSVGDMIHPRCNDVTSFLWNHLEKDMRVLGDALDQNLNSTAITVHLILRACADSTGSWDGALDLSTRQRRQQWERLVCDAAINPVLHNLQQNLAEAQRTITTGGGLVGSPMMKILFGDPATVLSLPAECPTDCSSFWTLPENMTVKRFSQLVEQSAEHSSLHLLIMFLQKIHCVKQLHHLPELAALQSDLLRIGPLISDCRSQSINQVLQDMPAGCQKKMLVGRVERFITVWNSLRADVAKHATDLGVEVRLCEMEMSKLSSGEFLTPSRHGPGSCLQILLELLLKTQNGLLREARKWSCQDDREYIVPLERVSESQLVQCHPERDLLPLVLSHCHYTLMKGGETNSSYDLPAIQMQLVRRYLAGKPLIKEGTWKYLNRHLQDFSVVLAEVRGKIPQAPLKGSVCGALRTVLRSYADVCDAAFVLEIGLRFLAKTGGDPQEQLLSFLTKSLQLGSQISSTVAKSLGESRLKHSVFTWQLLTCWKSELMLKRKQDPFQRLPSEFQQKLSEVNCRALRQFLAVTDVDAFALELHEVLLLKTSNAVPDEGYQAHWDIKSTLESHLDQKELPPLLGLEVLPEEITLGQGADVWRATVEFKRR